MTRTKPRPCSLCRRRPRSTHVIGPDLCDPCHEYAGWENTHSDEDHDGIAAGHGLDSPVGLDSITQTMTACPICNNVTPPWEETPVKTKTAPRVRTNPTTSNMSHASCSHPRTPKGRAACRKALRSGSTLVSAPTLPYVRIGKSKTVHVPGACVTVKRHDGAIERTDDAVTCKNCIKVSI